MSWKTVSAIVRDKVEKVDALRREQKMTGAEACKKVGIPTGTYSHARWKMRGGKNGVKTSHPGRPKTQPVPTTPTVEADATKLVNDVRRLVKRIDAELAEHEKLIAARTRLQAMLNASEVEYRMNDLDEPASRSCSASERCRSNVERGGESERP